MNHIHLLLRQHSNPTEEKGKLKGQNFVLKTFCQFFWFTLTFDTPQKCVHTRMSLGAFLEKHFGKKTETRDVFSMTVNTIFVFFYRLFDVLTISILLTNLLTIFNRLTDDSYFFHHKICFTNEVREGGRNGVSQPHTSRPVHRTQ